MSIFTDKEKIEKIRKEIDKGLIEMRKGNQISEKDYPAARFMIAYLVMPEHIMVYKQHRKWLQTFANVKDFNAYFHRLKKNGYLTVDEVNKMERVIDDNESGVYQLLLMETIQGLIERKKKHPTDYNKDAFSISDEGSDYLENKYKREIEAMKIITELYKDKLNKEDLMKLCINFALKHEIPDGIKKFLEQKEKEKGLEE